MMQQKAAVFVTCISCGNYIVTCNWRWIQVILVIEAFGQLRGVRGINNQAPCWWLIYISCGIPIFIWLWSSSYTHTNFWPYNNMYSCLFKQEFYSFFFIAHLFGRFHFYLCTIVLWFWKNPLQEVIFLVILFSFLFSFPFYTEVNGSILQHIYWNKSHLYIVECNFCRFENLNWLYKFSSQLYSFATSGAAECIFAIIECSNTSREVHFTFNCNNHLAMFLFRHL